MQSALARKGQIVAGQAPQVEPNVAPAKLPLARMRSEPMMYDISVDSDMEEAQVSAVSKKVAKRVEDFAGKHGLDDKSKSRLMHASTDEVAEEVVSRPLGPGVRNPSAYMTRVIQQLEKEAAAPQHDDHQQDEVEQWGDEHWDEE